MDRSLVETLNGLIPTLTGTLPQELIELTVSLLAQSRSNASSLRADEEIARSYACANLACERLKQTLGLPKIQPRPPCPPKVYQNLYRYLESALTAGTRRSTRLPRKIDSKSKATSSPPQPRTPAKFTPIKPDTRQKKTPQISAEIAAWIMPAIRQLCKRMGAPAAPHHIFAGVSSILVLHGCNISQNSAEQQSMVNTPALIVAVYLLVTTRLAGIRTAPAKYDEQIALALEILKDVAGKDSEHGGAEKADVDKCMREVRDQRWTQMDWFYNITAGSGLGVDEGLEEDVDTIPIEEEAESEQQLPGKRKLNRPDSVDQEYLQVGLGTMMRDQVDYLSDERKRDYQAWKKDILRRITELEKSEPIDLNGV